MNWKGNMQEASEETWNFERCHRHTVSCIQQCTVRYAQKQKITNTDGEDKDIIALSER